MLNSVAYTQTKTMTEFHGYFAFDNYWFNVVWGYICIIVWSMRKMYSSDIFAAFYGTNMKITNDRELKSKKVNEKK